MEEELTFKQIDALEDDFYIFSEDSSLDAATTIADILDGQIYTQIDGEEARIYLKGVHIVNRTGTYAVRIPSK